MIYQFAFALTLLMNDLPWYAASGELPVWSVSGPQCSLTNGAPFTEWKCDKGLRVISVGTYLHFRCIALEERKGDSWTMSQWRPNPLCYDERGFQEPAMPDNPLIGASEYGWRFVGTETDPAALRWAAKLVASNETTARLVECRLQPSTRECFRDVIRPGEAFDLSMCNPPFHASAAEAAAAAGRKRRNLGAGQTGTKGLNFGGRAGELWCPGGELGFVRRMIEQSRGYAGQCRWFTTLVSRSAHLPRFQEILRDAGAAEVRVSVQTHLDPGHTGITPR